MTELALDTFPQQFPDVSYAPEEDDDTGEPHVDKAVEQGLEEVRLMTRMIREHQEQIVKLAKKRKARVMKLRRSKVTYREIAEAMGTSEQTVYNVIRSEG